jgi:hypothetical protein
VELLTFKLVVHRTISRPENIKSSVISPQLSLIFSFDMSCGNCIELSAVNALGNCNRSFRFC